MCGRFIREWPEEQHPEGSKEKGSRTGHWEKLNCHTVVKRPQGVARVGEQVVEGALELGRPFRDGPH